jgi:poly-gamma-glutamate capsule biosynthesis protein CapA/YwtB (metallophosphatase superfamily)
VAPLGAAEGTLGGARAAYREVVENAGLTLFLAGDVMTGRGVDQILPTPSPPGLRERSVRDARTYVRLAEEANGAISRPVDVAWPWGDALRVLDEARPDVRLINLETSVTRSDDYARGKGIHYRMHPDNAACLSVVRPDACALANNHVLDFGIRGLRETLDTLTRARLGPVGAGRDDDEAWRPAVIDLHGGTRVVIWSVADSSSGVPPSWAATPDRPGVALLRDVSDACAAALAGLIRRVTRPGDLVVVSIHWGSNWGYDVPPAHVRFARRLVDTGVHVVHGHSSHHPRPVEVYRGRLILYGCGDLIDDYEGISGYEQYRTDLRLLYLAALDRGTGALLRLRMVPMQARQMRLCRADPTDGRWLHGVLNEISAPYRSRIGVDPDGTLVLRAT